MPDSFNFQHPPFDELSPSQQKKLRENLDITYYPDGEQILTTGERATHLHIIIKGVVEELSQDTSEVYAHYTSDDLFDIRSQLGGYCKHDYKCIEESICYLLPSDVFRELMAENGEFADYFQTDLSQKYAQLEAREGDKNLGEFILTHIDESNLQPAMVIGADVSIKTATQMMQEQKLETLLVEHEGHYGVLTVTDLLHAAVLDEQPSSEPVRHYASFNLIAIEKGDFLFNAMLAMTQHHIERVVVKDGETILGILEMSHLLSLFSTHSHVLALRIARASTIAELKSAAGTTNKLVENLTNNGIKIVFIMKLLATINEQIMRRLFELLVPVDIQPHICLMVLGSEGRGEQILKTDQDNGLIIEDNFHWPEQQQTMELFSQTLLELGYPPCPGKVMVNNPEWVKYESDWVNSTLNWINSGSGDDLMKLAIVADCHGVAGNNKLICRFRQQIFSLAGEQEVSMSNFAKVALQFSTPLTLFGNLKSGDSGLDIKKGGIFTLVHGVRALALKQGVEQTNTLERIQRLKQLKVLDEKMANNLRESFQLFLRLRLKQQLSEKNTSNLLQLQSISRNERDLLRQSLHAVKKFKGHLAHHFMIRDY